MLRSVVSNGALRFALLTESRRNLAIMPTVKKATDTSAEEFPAPSHVNLAADATAIARDYREFFTNPGTFISSATSYRLQLGVRCGAFLPLWTDRRCDHSPS